MYFNLVSGDDELSRGLPGPLLGGDSFHLQSCCLHNQIRLLQPHQVSVLSKEKLIILQFLLRFTRARGFEDKSIVSTLDGSYYMENNCVHGQHHPHHFN